MKKKLLVGAGVALIVLLLAGLGGAAFVFAQEPTPPIPFGWHGGGRGMGGFGRGGFGWAGGGPWTMFDTAAETLGLTPEELFAELRAGKSPAEIAEEQGVDVEALYDAMSAARGEAMQQAIQQAIEDGRITQEQADQMLERLEGRPSSPEELVEARKEAIQQAVEDGRMSQEQADWMLQGLEQGWWGGRGFGRGFGYKGCPPLESE
jgi:polyhydroxyalkanoate synthesis regulator phasin